MYIETSDGSIWTPFLKRILKLSGIIPGQIRVSNAGEKFIIEGMCVCETGDGSSAACSVQLMFYLSSVLCDRLHLVDADKSDQLLFGSLRHHFVSLDELRL